MSRRRKWRRTRRRRGQTGKIVGEVTGIRRGSPGGGVTTRRKGGTTPLSDHLSSTQLTRTYTQTHTQTCMLHFHTFRRTEQQPYVWPMLFFFFFAFFFSFAISFFTFRKRHIL